MNAENAIDTVVRKVLMLFVDVVCFFVDDFTGPEDCTRLLHRWSNETTTMAPPRVIFISNTVGVGKALCMVPKTSRWVQLSSGRGRSHCVARSKTLRTAIMREVSLRRKDKLASRVRLSTTHLSAMFRLALRHFAKCDRSEFNFILASRTMNNVDHDFNQLLVNFLTLCLQKNVEIDTALSFIASALVLDSLPPGMHCKSKLG